MSSHRLEMRLPGKYYSVLEVLSREKQVTVSEVIRDLVRGAAKARWPGVEFGELDLPPPKGGEGRR